MGVRLSVTTRGEAGSADDERAVTLDDDVILFGRHNECQVVLAQQAVSRNHARISREGALYFLEDLNSTYGTYVNGAQIPAGEKRLLRKGDVIGIGQFDVVFDKVADVKLEGDAGHTKFVSRKVVKDMMRGLNSNLELPFFRIMNGPKEGEKIEISDAQEYIFGRDEAAHIILMDDLVSRRHAKVRRDWSGTHVEDLQSRNGIRINQKKTLKATLKNHDELEIGAIRFLYVDPGDLSEPSAIAMGVDRPDEEEKTEAVEPTSVAPPSEESVPEEAAAPSGESVDSSTDSPPSDEAQASEGEAANAVLPEGGVESPPAPATRFIEQINFRDRRTQIILGVVGTVVLGVVTLFVLLFVGA